MNIELEQKSPLSHCCRSAPSRETRKELSSLDFLGCFLRQFNVTSACQETDITCTCHPACSTNPMCLPQKRENWIIRCAAAIFSFFFICIARDFPVIHSMYIHHGDFFPWSQSYVIPVVTKGKYAKFFYVWVWDKFPFIRTMGWCTFWVFNFVSTCVFTSFSIFWSISHRFPVRAEVCKWK